jgi:hypothetical protein
MKSIIVTSKPGMTPWITVSTMSEAFHESKKAKATGLDGRILTNNKPTTNQQTKMTNTIDTIDTTEQIRRQSVGEINTAVESNDKDKERIRLEKLYGQVWTTDELQKEFDVISFMAPYVKVRRRSDCVYGTLTFQHTPRLYFSFKAEQTSET